MPFQYCTENAQEYYVFTQDFGVFNFGDKFPIENLVFDFEDARLLAFDNQGFLIKSQEFFIECAYNG